MAVVHVSHFEARALAVQAAGAQSGQTALVRQLGQRVRLVHELGQRGRSEELLDAAATGRMLMRLCGVISLGSWMRHALANDALHTGKTDAELVLQQLAHAAHAAVAEWSISSVADAVRQRACS